MDKKILKYLYSKKNDGTFHDVSKLFPTTADKHSIDTCVVTMEEIGYVSKVVKGYLNKSAISPGDDPEDANNSRCKITRLGIEYIDNSKKVNFAHTFSIIATIISFLALVLTALSYFKS